MQRPQLYLEGWGHVRASRMRLSNNVYMRPSIWLPISFAKYNAYHPGAQCSLEVIPTSVPNDDQPDAPCGLKIIPNCDDQLNAPCSLAAICQVIPKLSCNVMFGWRESTITIPPFLDMMVSEVVMTVSKKNKNTREDKKKKKSASQWLLTAVVLLFSFFTPSLFFSI